MKKKIAAVVFALLIISLSWFGWTIYQDVKAVKLVDHLYDQLIDKSEISKDMTVQEKADMLRTKIHMNSVHKIDEEFYSYWKDKEELLTRLNNHIENPQSFPPPHMECSVRATLLYQALDKLGARLRIINLHEYKPDYPAHVLIEIYNADTGKWELQDPDYNIFWRDLESGGRAGIEDILARPVEEFTPCYSEDKCGYDRFDVPYKIESNDIDYYGLAVIKDVQQGSRDLIYNPDRFNLDVAAGSETYCDFVPKNCTGKITTLP